MSDHPFMDSEEEGESADEESEGGSDRTTINVSIGNLSIKVENHDKQEAEAQFYRIYEYLMEDVAEWSRAMDSVLTERGGFQ